MINDHYQLLMINNQNTPLVAEQPGLSNDRIRLIEIGCINHPIRPGLANTLTNS